MAESYSCVNSCCEAQQEETSLLWFQLGTCAHSLCALCFSSANATRCCSPYITCTLCKQISTGWSVVQHGTEIGTFAIEEPSLAKDPKQFHKLKWEEMQSSAVLAMTIPVDGGIKTIVAVLDEKKKTAEWDEIQIKNLLTIFGALNSYLIESDYDPGDDNLAMYVNPVEEAFAGDRVCSVLHRCIHAFATQEYIYDEPVFSTKWRSRRAATFAATDIIRCLKKSKEGKLKRFVGRQMIANGASQGLWKILSKFGLVTDMKKERRNAIDMVNTEMMKGLTAIDPHDLWLLLYDNIGFKVLKGYEQYTAMQWVRIPKETLCLWGLYPKEFETMQSYPFEGMLNYERIWNRLNWEAIRSETEFEDVLGIEECDVQRLADSMYTMVDQLLEVIDQLPSVEEAIELLNRVNNKAWTDKYQAKDNREEQESNDGVHISGVAIETTPVVTEKEKFETNYKANNAVIDRPVKRDLNAKATCEAMLDYGLEMRDRVIGKEATGRWSDIPKVLEETPLPLCGDGNPTYLCSILLRDKHEKYKGKVSAFSGGFHQLLEAHRKRGDAFGKSHLEDVFSCWRPSEGQLRWVMNPGDPNQISAELSMYVLAMYSAAIRSCLQTKARNNADNSCDEIKICARDVVDHMVDRAKQYPIVMMVLMELRFAQLTFMLHESERNGGDVNLFLTAQKFLGRLYASTHCTKYVSMLADFFVEWHCCSPAERIIFEKGIFTRKTKNGDTIFTDRFVEWMMRDFRMWMGKTGNIFTETLLERCALQLAKMKEARNLCKAAERGGSSSPDIEDDDEAGIEVDYVFCEVFVFASETNLFGPGEPLHYKKQASSKGRGESRGKGKTYGRTDDASLSTICNEKEQLNKNSLRIYSVGNSRLKRYFDTFHKDGDIMDPYRGEINSNGGVSLKSIKPLKVDAEKDINDKVIASTSTKFNEIQKHYSNQASAHVEVTYLHEYVEQNIDETISDDLRCDSDDQVESSIAKIMVLRQLIIKHDKFWVTNRSMEIKISLEQEQGEHDQSIQEIIDTELEDDFFKLQSFTTERATRLHTFIPLPDLAGILPDLAGITIDHDIENRRDAIGIGEFTYDDLF